MAYDNEVPVARRVVRVVKRKEPQLVKFLRALPIWIYGVAGLSFMLPMVIFSLGSARPKTLPQANPPKTVTPKAKPDTLLGHNAYNEAPSADLTTIGVASDGYELRLRTAAANNFLRMQSDAGYDGVNLVVISAFRSKKEQEQLFFEVSRQRNQTPAERAQVSAPPGYSEHHTGYAIDIGDSNNPSTNLSESFGKTLAYEWLKKNAPRYGYELSFPQNNPQGVLYEPWHWRFVGNADSLKTFYKK